MARQQLMLPASQRGKHDESELERSQRMRQGSAANAEGSGRRDVSRESVLCSGRTDALCGA